MSKQIYGNKSDDGASYEYDATLRQMFGRISWHASVHPGAVGGTAAFYDGAIHGQIDHDEAFVRLAIEDAIEGRLSSYSI